MLSTLSRAALVVRSALYIDDKYDVVDNSKKVVSTCVFGSYF